MCNITRYTVGIILLAENENELQRLLFQLNEFCHNYNMEIAEGKIKMILFSCKPVEHKLMVNDDKIIK